MIGKFWFKIAGIIIKFLKEKAVKYLGKIFNCDLKERSALQKCFRKLEEIRVARPL